MWNEIHVFWIELLGWKEGGYRHVWENLQMRWRQHEGSVPEQGKVGIPKVWKSLTIKHTFIVLFWNAHSFYGNFNMRAHILKYLENTSPLMILLKRAPHLSESHRSVSYHSFLAEAGVLNANEINQSWALSVFFNFFNNKKWFFLHFLSS